MFSYEDEIKSQVTATFFKVVIPILTPVYLLSCVVDWIVAPSFTAEFFFVRLTVLPAIAFSYLILKKNPSESWCAFTVWFCAFILSLHLTYMGYRVGGDSSSVYLQSINLMAVAVLFLFPMRLGRNLATLACVYFPPGIFLAAYFFTGKADIIPLPLALLYLGMFILLSVTAAGLDRLRYKTFQQKLNLFFLATTDVLSGLKLRRYFFNRFIQEISLRFRSAQELVLSVVMFDVDGFKKINDQYGHDVGDRCVKRIGEIVRDNIRIYDTPCRLGGEEFVILLPETTLENAKIVGERIRQAVEGSVVRADSKEVKMTVSVGISGIHVKIPESFKQIQKEKNQNLLVVKHMLDMIKKADDSLYAAKQKGKNCTFVGSPVDFSLSFDQTELEALRGYLIYFDQDLFSLRPEEIKEDAARLDEEVNFYPEEYFFRRCVESISRYHRNPEWLELLVFFRIKLADGAAVKKVLSRAFRMTDTFCHLEPEVYGVIFFGMAEESLRQVTERVRKRIEVISPSGLGKVAMSVAACPLKFEARKPVEKMRYLPSYRHFSNEVAKHFELLRRHLFIQKEEFYYHRVITADEAWYRDKVS